MKKLMFLAAVAAAVFLSQGQSFSEESMAVIADFESHPNNLGGEVGVYGSLEPNWDDKASPFSWYYAPSAPGYDVKNVHSGKQSFRLVNALGTKKAETWGSFSMDLGLTTDATTTPKKVKSLDVTKYKYLTFWLKGDKGGEKLELLFRDSHAQNYMPQAKYKVQDAVPEWVKISVPLEEIQKLGIDLKALDNIGIAFGPDAGNKQGAIIYVDDFAFTEK
jgi:hypothetical protein